MPDRANGKTPYHLPAPAYQVTDVYGARCYVRIEDHDDPRIRFQVPLTTKDGIRINYRTDKTGRFMPFPAGKASTIHRENIASIKTITPPAPQPALI